MEGKIKIIYLTSFAMTKFKWFIKEMDCLEKNSDFEAHELCDFLFPGGRKAFGDTHKSEKIFTFKTFLDWKNYVLNLQQKCIKERKKLVILTELSNYPRLGFNLKYLMVNKFLKQHQVDYYEFNNSGLPSSKASMQNYLKFIKIFKYGKYLLLRINELLTSFFGTLLDLKPKGIFVAGSQTKKKLEKLKKIRDIELINFNSWEFSSTLNKKNNYINPSKGKYAIFINLPGLKKKTDEELFNLDVPESPEKWYPALDNFFSYLEKIFNLKIIIASHPKSDEEGCLDYLGNRTAVLNKTEELIRGSEFVISVNSTALIFAIIYKKPIFLIYSNETKKDLSILRGVNNMSNYFKIKSINIDESFSESQIKSLINFDEKLYENYKIDFLASNSKNKNYQIILESLNKFNK